MNEFILIKIHLLMAFTMYVLLTKIVCYQFMIGVKAMANIGVASVLLKDELKLMIEDESVNIDLRVAAVDVHRRLPCDESRSYFEKLFRNQMFDSEIRIASYLQIMRCPNYIVIAAIQNSLEVEEVNQGN